VQYNAMQYNAVQCSAVQGRAVKYIAVQYSAVVYNAWLDSLRSIGCNSCEPHNGFFDSGTTIRPLEENTAFIGNISGNLHYIFNNRPKFS
jgi:hypothetical protein